jgi:hypothetical protein
VFRDGLRLGDVNAASTGTWADGDVLGFDGTSIVPGNAGTHKGTAVLDFGATFEDNASAVVTGQSWVTDDSHISAWFVGDDVTSDSIAAEHEYLGATCAVIVADRVPGVGFTINAYSGQGYGKGQFKVYWEGVAPTANVVFVDDVAVTVDGELVTVT